MHMTILVSGTYILTFLTLAEIGLSFSGFYSFASHSSIAYQNVCSSQTPMCTSMQVSSAFLFLHYVGLVLFVVAAMKRTKEVEVTVAKPEGAHRDTSTKVLMGLFALAMLGQVC